MFNLFSKIKSVLSLTTVSLFSFLFAANPALAQATWDATAVTTELNGSKPIIVAVGTAIFGVIALIVGYRMIRKITG